VLTAIRAVADYYEGVVHAGAEAKAAANAAIANKTNRGITASRVLRTLSNRPGNIFRDIGLLSAVCSYSRAARLSRRRD